MKIVENNEFTNIEKYFEGFKNQDFFVDLSSANIFDSLKFAVLSSTYLSQIAPDTKMKCKVESEDIRSLILSFKINNLEFV